MDKKLKDIDKSVGQTQREVGNYKEQVKDALSETNLWAESIGGAVDQTGILNEILSKITVLISFLTKLQEKYTEETKESTQAQVSNEVATKKQSRSLGRLLKRIVSVTAAQKLFNIALKASPLGLVILALGSIAAGLSRTQEGLDRVRGLTLSFGADGIIAELSDRLIKLGPALFAVGKIITSPLRLIFNLLQSLGNAFELLGLKIEKAFTFFEDTTQLEKQIDKLSTRLGENLDEALSAVTDLPSDIATATSGFTDFFDGLIDSISSIVDRATPLGKILNDLEFQIAKSTKAQAKYNAEAEKLEAIEADATASLNDRRNAIIKAANASAKASKEAVKQAQLELEIFEKTNAFNQQGLEDTNEIKSKRIALENALLQAENEAFLKSKEINNKKATTGARLNRAKVRYYYRRF